MPGLGRYQPQYYQSSGEATDQAQLPEKFISNMPPPSPINGYNPPPHASYCDPRNVPKVDRHERTNGMRYLYALGHVMMPVKRLGADGQPYPWTSGFNKNMHGPIHDAGFNDALYQAGYPGFNLGLSFKVPTLAQNQTVPTRGVQKSINITQKLVRVKRATGQPRNT